MNELYSFLNDIWHESFYKNPTTPAYKQDYTTRVVEYQQYFFLEFIQYKINQNPNIIITNQDILDCQEEAKKFTNYYLNYYKKNIYNENLDINLDFPTPNKFYTTDEEFELNFEKIRCPETLENFRLENKNLKTKTKWINFGTYAKETLLEYINRIIFKLEEDKPYLVPTIEFIVYFYKDILIDFIWKLNNILSMSILYIQDPIEYFRVKKEKNKENSEEEYHFLYKDININYHRENIKQYYYIIYSLKFLHWLPNLPNFNPFKIKNNFFDYPGGSDYIKYFKSKSWWYPFKSTPIAKWSIFKLNIDHDFIMDQIRKQKHKKDTYIPTPEEVNEYIDKVKEQDNFLNRLLTRYLDYKLRETNDEIHHEIPTQTMRHIWTRTTSIIVISIYTIYLFFKYFIYDLLIRPTIGPLTNATINMGNDILDFILIIPLPTLPDISKFLYLPEINNIIEYYYIKIFLFLKFYNFLHEPTFVIEIIKIKLMLLKQKYSYAVFDYLSTKYNTIHTLYTYDNIVNTIYMADISEPLLIIKIILFFIICIKIIIFYDNILNYLYKILERLKKKHLIFIYTIEQNFLEYYTFLIKIILVYLTALLYPIWRTAVRNYLPKRHIYSKPDELIDAIFKYINDSKILINFLNCIYIIFSYRYKYNLQFRITIIINKIIDFIFYIFYICNLFWILLFIYQIFIQILVPLYLFQYITEAYEHIYTDFFNYYPLNLTLYNNKYKIDFLIYLYIIITYFKILQIVKLKYTFNELKNLFIFTNIYIIFIHINNLDYCFLAFFLLKRYFYPSFLIVTIFYYKRFASFKNYKKLYILGVFLIKLFLFFNTLYFFLICLLSLLHYTKFYFLIFSFKTIFKIIIILLNMMFLMMFFKIITEINTYYYIVFQEKLLYIKAKKKPKIPTDIHKNYITYLSIFSCILIIHSWYIFTHAIYLLDTLIHFSQDKFLILYNILEMDYDIKHDLHYDDNYIDEEDEEDEYNYEE
jgi:hypothetical protein